MADYVRARSPGRKQERMDAIMEAAGALSKKKPRLSEGHGLFRPSAHPNTCDMLTRGQFAIRENASAGTA